MRRVELCYAPYIISLTAVMEALLEGGPSKGSSGNECHGSCSCSVYGTCYPCGEGEWPYCSRAVDDACCSQDENPEVWPPVLRIISRHLPEVWGLFRLECSKEHLDTFGLFSMIFPFLPFASWRPWTKHLQRCPLILEKEIHRGANLIYPVGVPIVIKLSIHVSTLRIILWYKFCYVYLVHVFWSFHVLSARHFYTCSLLLAHLPREAMLCDPSYGCCSGTLGILAFRIPCNAWGSWNRGQPRREMQPCHSWMRWQHV